LSRGYEAAVREFGLSSTPEFNEQQLATARAQRWHQDGAALLTLEDARTWVGEAGLVLFAPRAQQLATPAPSLVEATLGKATDAPTAAETDLARSFVARLTAEGDALPLNLLGGPGDVPDFVVSAQVFSYVFTVRGDKLWKQPPATSGAMKVSLLAAKVYETVAEGKALTAAELASELGREVTEAAIGRALGELWAQLRVIPLLQQDGSAALWELTSRRFTKTMKAGGNAGLPTALSALVSMYLAQVFAATEEEIETFLSPLTARSRVRDVLHGLTGARQLETLAVEGKTLLYIPGALPEFPAAAAAEGTIENVEAAAAAAVERPKKVGTGRIRSFEGERKPGGEFRGKPARTFAAGRSGAGGTRPSVRTGARSGARPGARPGVRPGARAGARPGAGAGARAEGRTDRERRPFKREGAGGDARTSFTKPWEEGRKPRTASAAADGGADPFKKFRKPAAEERKPLGDREQAGLPPEERVFSKPKFERESKARDLAKRPYTPRDAEGGKRTFAKRPYTPRGSESGERSFSKPRFDRDKKPGGFGAKPGGFGAKRPYKPRDAEGGEGTFAKRPYTPRTSESGERSVSKPRFDRDKKPGGFGAKPGGFGAKRPYKPRDAEGGERSFTKRPYTPRTSEGGERSLSKSAKPRFDSKSKPGGFGAKRPYKPRDTEGGERTFAKRPYTPRTSEGGERSEGSIAKRPYKPRVEGGSERRDAAPRKSFGAKKFGAKPGAKFGSKFGAKAGGAKAGKFGPKKFGAKPGGFGAKRSGAAGKAKPASRKPEAEE